MAAFAARYSYYSGVGPMVAWPLLRKLFGVLSLVAGGLASFLLGKLAIAKIASGQDFSHFACGSSPTGDCVGWGLITVGPIFLLMKMSLYLLASVASTLPIALGGFLAWKLLWGDDV